MSRALQKAIVYELFAVVLAIVVAAAAVAESVTAGYLTVPWLFFVVPLAIALVGFLRALRAGPDDGGATTDSRADDGTSPPEEDDTSEPQVEASDANASLPFYEGVCRYTVSLRPP